MRLLLGENQFQNKGSKGDMSFGLGFERWDDFENVRRAPVDKLKAVKMRKVAKHRKSK